MTETRDSGEPLLRGGAGVNKTRHTAQDRSIIQVAHADSTIRLWDIGHGDEIENPLQLEVDVARSVNRYQNVEISAMDIGTATGEFVVGTGQGEVVIYRWAENRFVGKENPMEDLQPATGSISDISARAPPNLRVGLIPSFLYQMDQGRISAIKVSEIGFIGIGSENGVFSIVDLRGPRVMLNASVADFAKSDKRSSILGHRKSSTTPAREWATSIEFSVMTLEGDSYSSIVCFVGTSLGRVGTFRILPSGDGYTAQLAGAVNFGDKIVSLSPILAENGRPALASGTVVAGLRSGQQVHGLLVVVTQTEIRVFKPATSKGASKSFDDILCDAANVTFLESTQSCAVVALFGDMTTRAFTLPALKEFGKKPLSLLDSSRSTTAQITRSGHIVGWTGPSQLAVVHVWGAGRQLCPSMDTLVNPDLEIPPRPTISSLQWIAGTQYISPTDFDLLIGGPDRPPSKRMLAAAADEASGNSGANRPGSGGQTARIGAAAQQQEGWGDYLTRQLNERTERLNILDDRVDGLADASSSWAEDASRYVNKQKKSMFMAGLKGKFF